MKSKQEILAHLATTVYTHNARKSIVQWMLQQHVVDYKCQINFAKHVYNREGVRMTEGLSFEDFLNFVLFDSLDDFGDRLNDAVKAFFGSFPDTIDIHANIAYNGDFQVGDAVKYMPSSDESSTEYVKAIAHGSDGETYLCLSNGEYVRPSRCLKYKVQGDDRRKLIDKLNEVI